MKIYVVADIAGRFSELTKLLERFEQPNQIVCVGDIVDRGTQSKEVVEYLMAHPEIVVLLGNHELLMLEAHHRQHAYVELPENYVPGPEHWLSQGGAQTLQSFGKVPDKVLDWIAHLPLQQEIEIEGKRYLITHAPVPDPDEPWREEPVRLWNRYPPRRDSRYALQIYGHNSKLEWIADNEGAYAVCIDDCRNRHLTALELPTFRLLHQPYEVAR